MTGTSRSRNRDARTHVYGELEYYWPMRAVYDNAVFQGEETDCDDVVGNWHGANPFDVTHTTTYSPLVNGLLYVGTTKAREFRDFPIDYNVIAKSSRAAFPAPDLIQIGQEAAARTNPSTAHISVPTALAEMKDFPDLVQALGLSIFNGALQNRRLRKLLFPRRPKESSNMRRFLDFDIYYERPKGEIWSATSGNRPARPVVRFPSEGTWKDPEKRVKWANIVRNPFRIPQIAEILRGLAAGHITNRFAIAPVISDIRALLSFQKAADKRFEYLERLRKKKVARRRVGMGSDSYAVDNGTKTIQSRGAVITAKERVEYTLDSWATVTWRAQWDGLKPEIFQNNRILAEKLVYGISDFESFVTAWELIPWSWLTDWFTGMQDLILAHNNTVGATAIEVCYMATTSSRTTWSNISHPGWVSLSGPFYAGEVRKVRIVVPTSLLYMPTVSLPMLTHKQWSILGSLLVLAI